METNKAVIVINIEHCVQCPFHLIIPDPDPDDWFEDDDEALVCTHPECEVEYTEIQKQYYTERGLLKMGRVIESGNRPYQTSKVTIPCFCPLLKNHETK